MSAPIGKLSYFSKIFSFRQTYSNKCYKIIEKPSYGKHSQLCILVKLDYNQEHIHWEFSCNLLRILLNCINTSVTKTL